MFAYCENNPIIRADPTGEFFWMVVGIAVTVGLTFMLTGCASKPRQDLANAPDLDSNKAPKDSYNCYGNGIGKQVLADPSGYQQGDSTEQTFRAVQKDLGKQNVRRLKSINDPIKQNEFKVAMKCGPMDYYFIRLDEKGWYNKSGEKPGIYIDEDGVKSPVWFAMWEENGKCVVGDPKFGFPYYNDTTIYFAVKIGWDRS